MPSRKECFAAALKDLLDKGKYGIKSQTARAANVSPSLIGDIIAGRTYGAEERQRAIAAALGYPDKKFEDFLELGRSLITGCPLPKEESTALSEDEMRARGFFPMPFSDNMKLAAISPEREMELLRKMEVLTDDLRAAAVRRDYLADELHAADNRIKEKEKIISTTVEALRIKDIEVAEKRELLTGKDKIIQQLVDLLKEAGLEHTIPPALASLIRTNQEQSQER